MSQRSEQLEQAMLNFASAKSILTANEAQLEAALLNGTRDNIEVARSGLMGAAEAVADRMAEVVWHQMIDQGIDPKKRWLT